MPSQPPTIYVIAGCNGAGKTTFARQFLPYEVKCLRFLNADEIARGLSPLKPDAGAVKAARLLLEELKLNLSRKQTFALESTLSGKTYIRLFREALELGYEIEVHYLWLAKPSQAVSRVRKRIKLGGHAVPEADIRRRFIRSRQHLVLEYLPLATRWSIWDNQKLKVKQLASSETHAIDFVSKILGL
jgi:predicted ABC-type ATPase